MGLKKAIEYLKKWLIKIVLVIIMGIILYHKLILREFVNKKKEKKFG